MIKKLRFSFLLFICLVLMGGTLPVMAKKHSSRGHLKKVIKTIEKGNYVLGSRELYRLSGLPIYRKRIMQIKYSLGIAFLEMKLYHLASLQFVYVIKRSRGLYKRKSIEKLSAVFSYFEDDQLFCPLNTYIKSGGFTSAVRDRLNFYFGKCAYNRRDFKQASRYLSKIPARASFYSKAMYYLALVYAEQNNVKRSADVFRDLAAGRRGVTDTNRVAALMGLARVFYQGKRFEESIKIYRSIPKDTVYFYDSLMENSWNYLQAGKFRSALSNFQTLHSAFYQNRYQPESLILRAYVYLYLCKYYEMEKVLDLFNALYLPILKDLNRSLKWGASSSRAFLKSVLNHQRDRQRGLEFADGSSFHNVALDRIFRDSEFRSMINYLRKLEEEQNLLESFPSRWKRARVGRNTAYILRRRILSTQKNANKRVKQLLLDMKRDLKRLVTSEQYLRYDMLKGKREFLKKKIARKYLNKEQIDATITRSYYIQNGYEYWPFDGENWLDELGNYHYLGRQNCE